MSTRLSLYENAIINFIALIVPLPAVIISLAVKEYNYNQVRFPPSFCISNVEMTFYSEILIIDILACTGICLFVLVLWFVHKVYTVIVYNVL